MGPSWSAPTSSAACGTTGPWYPSAVGRVAEPPCCILNATAQWPLAAPSVPQAPPAPCRLYELAGHSQTCQSGLLSAGPQRALATRPQTASKRLTSADHVGLCRLVQTLAIPPGGSPRVSSAVGGRRRGCRATNGKCLLPGKATPSDVDARHSFTRRIGPRRSSGTAALTAPASPNPIGQAGFRNPLRVGRRRVLAARCQPAAAPLSELVA